MARVWPLNFVLLSECIFQTFGQLRLEPYGPKMCNMLCNRTKNCSDRIFDEVQLSCQLVVNVSASVNTPKGKGLGLCDDVAKENMKNIFTRTQTRNTTASRQPDGMMTDQNSGGLRCPFEDDEEEDFVGVCYDGDLDEVKRLVCQGLVDINCRGSDEQTCVMEASNTGNSRMFDFLVKFGCDLSVVDVDNSTVLHHAAIGGSIYIIKKLVDDYKSDIHWRDTSGATPLFFAQNLQVFNILEDRGANLKAIDNYNNTILHVMCEYGRIDVIRYILSHDIIDLECKGKNGKTPLMMAVKNKKLVVVRILYVQHGASLTLSDDFGLNVLHLACLTGELDMVKYLIDHDELRGFEKKRDRSGKTPMQLAIRNGYEEIVTSLKSWKY